MHVNIGIGDYKADVVEGMAKGGLRKETGFNQNLEGEAGEEAELRWEAVLCKVMMLGEETAKSWGTQGGWEHSISGEPVNAPQEEKSGKGQTRGMSKRENGKDTGSHPGSTTEELVDLRKPYQALLVLASPPEKCGQLMCLAFLSHRAAVRIQWDKVARVVKNLPAKAGDIRDASSIPGSRRSPGEGHGNPLQYSCLGNPHGQRSPAGYSAKGRRVGHNWSNFACGTQGVSKALETKTTHSC